MILFLIALISTEISMSVIATISSFGIFMQLQQSNMKRYSSSKKKKQNFVDQRSGQETATPRVKKSYSTTNATYLQLQLQTSSKKRQNMQKNLQNKDKRITDLQKQVKEYQKYMIQSTIKYRQLKNHCQHEKMRNQRLQQQLKEAVQLCKQMKDKCKELIDKNDDVEKNQQMLKQRLKKEQTKLKEFKQMRKRQKQDLKQLIIPLLQSLANKSTLSSEDLVKVSKIL